MGVVAYSGLSGRKVGWGGRLLTFSAFRMGANSRLGAYSNKYVNNNFICVVRDCAHMVGGSS